MPISIHQSHHWWTAMILQVFLGDRTVLLFIQKSQQYTSIVEPQLLRQWDYQLPELFVKARSSNHNFTRSMVGLYAIHWIPRIHMHENISSSEHISNISNAERINLDKLNAQIWHLAQYTSVSINITIAPRHMFVSWQSSSSTPMKVSLYSCGTSKCANCGEENSSLMACLWHSLVATKSRRHIRMWPRRKLSTVPHFSATALTQITNKVACNKHLLQVCAGTKNDDSKVFHITAYNSTNDISHKIFLVEQVSLLSNNTYGHSHT